MKATLTTIAGAALAVLGVGLFSPRAAVIVTGVVVCLAGLLFVEAGSSE